MREAETSPGSNSDSSARLLENPKFQAHAVPIALELMLTAVDQCRHMLQNLQLEKAFSSNTTTTGRGENLLPARERQVLDGAIASFWDDVESRVTSELGLNEEDSEGEEQIYPLAQETVATLVDLRIQKIKEEVARNHFGRYFEDPVKREYIVANVRLGTKTERESTLGTALLPMIVSKMEEFLGALVRIALTLHPETLGELSSVPDRIIKRYQAHISSSDILRWQIDQKVFDFINGSPDEWQAIIAKRMGIDIATVGADWARINEIIQRRHVITHNNGRVDESYMARVDDRLRIGLELGTPLLCGSNYILPALIEIETWTFCLALNWTKHFFKDRGQYHPRMISVVVDLEKVGRWTHALAVLDAFLRAPLPSGNISLARINRWFCLQEIGHNDESLEREIRAWKPQEADEEDALLAETGRAALLREYSELIRVLQRGIGAGMPSFEKKYLRDAPLMQRAMRESTSVARLLQGPEISVRRVQSRPKRHGRNKSR